MACFTRRRSQVRVLPRPPLNLFESATCNIDSETFPVLNPKNVSRTVSKRDRPCYTVSKLLSPFLLVGLAV